jgi:LmbE family N-acetylglucosaminyl deacetylase
MGARRRMKFKNVLVLSPHTDDAEIGAGGTIHKLLQEEAFVQVIAFSYCDNNHLIEEFNNSMTKLGVSHYTVLDYPRRQLDYHRIQILDYLYKLRTTGKYDLVITPSSSDVHQDHNTIYNETVRAFRKHATIWGYVLDWNIVQQHPITNYVILNQDDVDAKLRALSCYKSLNMDSRLPILQAFMATHGYIILEKYAEAFEVVRQRWK